MCGYCHHCLQFVQNSYELIQIQSDDVIRDDTIDSTVDQVQMEFNQDEIETKVLDSTTPLWYQPTTSSKSELSMYLNRPVLVTSTQWSVGSGLINSFSPWKEFLQHPSIKRKIDNYAFLRCDLHLKVMLNASPFYYGGLLVSYKPLKLSYDSAPINFALGSPLVPLSQNPHFYCYPQNSEGGEMILPFLSPTEWLDITNLTDVTNFGTVQYYSLTNLLNANSVGAGDINIQFYVWAENVTLAGLTTDTSLQSDDRSEYSTNGSISKPASAVARATGMLSKVPILGPYMTATSVAAGAVANIAALFGYTKVPVVDDTKPYKNLPFHGLAVSDISDCTEKLSVDSKNELTINNQCIGDPEADPLLISNFVQRSSYLTQFTWSATDVSDSLLWNTYINPYMSVVTADIDQHVINPTPMWVAANMFQYWRGDIIYDFKIISSQYHRGRLRFSWDPVGDVANTADTNTEVYTHIVDICETTNVSLRVPYNQRVAYLKTPDALDATIYNTSPLAVDTSDTVNGILTVRVVTEQTSPVSSADIIILVSVRGAENLEFAAPKYVTDDISFFEVQSDDRSMNEVTTHVMGEPSKVDNNINLVYMGEKVSNFRELLQRANHHISWSEVTSTSQSEYHRMLLARRPLYSGYDPNGVLSAIGINSAMVESYNFVSNTPYHLLSSCFLGERGSFTWKVNYDSIDPVSIWANRHKEPLTVVKYPPTATNLNVNSNILADQFARNSFSTTGALMINQKTNTGVSFNAPMYSQYTILDTNPEFRVLGKSGVSGDDSIEISWTTHEQSGHTEVDYHQVHLWFNCGPDYSPYFFLNVPTLYKYSTSPTPTP